MMKLTLQEKFHAFETDVNVDLLDRRDEIHSAMLAMISGKHLFLLGEPGVAKSMLVDEIVRRLTPATVFKWMLTKFSVPEEVFGGLDLPTMKESGTYRRITDGKLPSVDFAFIDEVFKANSSILNALLKVMNEGEFDNPGDDPNIPLITLFSASNEMPQSAELEALVDRFTLRHIVTGLQDPALFVQMLQLPSTPREPEAFLTLDEVRQAQQEAKQVEVGNNIYDAMLELKTKLKKEGIVVTDRRFHQSLSIIKAEAWMNGNTKAQVYDTTPLQYVMWRDPAHFDLVRKIVYDLADPLEREALKLAQEIEEAWTEFQAGMSESESPHRRGQQAIQTYSYFKKAREEWKSMNEEANKSGRQSRALRDIQKRLKHLTPQVLENGIGLDAEDVSNIDAQIEEGGKGL